MLQYHAPAYSGRRFGIGDADKNISRRELPLPLLSVVITASTTTADSTIAAKWQCITTKNCRFPLHRLLDSYCFVKNCPVVVVVVVITIAFAVALCSAQLRYGKKRLANSSLLADDASSQDSSDGQAKRSAAKRPYPH